MAAGDPPDDPLGSTWAAGSTGLDTIGATPGGPADGAAQLGPGARVGRHVLEALLGAGGMGVVYRAHDPQLDRTVAVKLVRSRAGGDSGRARLLREAQAMAKLRHANVVPIFDVGTAGDDVYVVMPLLEGGTLGSWTRAEPRAWHDVLDRFVAAGRGLVAAHAAGLVHRDFKPDNVLLGGDGEIQVADFGIARFEHDAPRSGEGPAAAVASLELTRTGDLLGTPAYMAPEQLRGESSDARADQFSFCVALWEGLYGERPFSPGEARGPAALAALLASIEGGKPATPSGREVPSWLREILGRGLRLRAAARWPSMAALLAAIAAHRRGPRRPLVIGVIAAAVVLAGAALAWNQWGRSSPPPRDPAATAPPTKPGSTTYRRERLTQRGDLLFGRLSPDGTTLALVGTNHVLVRGVGAGDGDRTLIELTGRAVMDLAWSPGGDQLAVVYGWGEGQRSDGNMELVEVASGKTTALAVFGSAVAFASRTQLVVGNATDRKVRVLELPGLDVTTACDVPGAYIWIDSIAVTVGREILVGVIDAEQRRSVPVVAPDCRSTTTLSLPGGIATFVVASGGRTIWMRDARTTSNDVVEMSLDGAEVSRRRLGGGEQVLLAGEHDGSFYHVSQDSQAVVERIVNGRREALLSSDADLEVAFSPDGSQVAWIERPTMGTGPLRVTSHDRIADRGPAIVTGAVDVAWSPDGTRLAVSVDDDRGIIVLDRASSTTRRIDRGELGVRLGLVWLDDRRIASATSDNRTIAWVDADGSASGVLIGRDWGRVFVPARSPRDGTVAFLGRPERGNLGVWTVRPGGQPVAVDGGAGAQPVWSSTGDLWTLDLVTGHVSRAALPGKREASYDVALSPQQIVRDVLILRDDELVLTLVRTVGDVSVSIPE